MMFVIGIVNVMMNLCYSFLFNCEDDGQNETDNGCDWDWDWDWDWDCD